MGKVKEMGIVLSDIYEWFDGPVIFKIVDRGREYLSILCDYKEVEGEEKDYYLVTDLDYVDNYSNDGELLLKDYYISQWLDGRVYYMEKVGDRLVSKGIDCLEELLPDEDTIIVV